MTGCFKYIYRCPGMDMLHSYEPHTMRYSDKEWHHIANGHDIPGHFDVLIGLQHPQPYFGIINIDFIWIGYIYIYIFLASVAPHHTHKWVVGFKPGEGYMGPLGYVPNSI